MSDINVSTLVRFIIRFELRLDVSKKKKKNRKKYQLLKNLKQYWSHSIRSHTIFCFCFSSIQKYAEIIISYSILHHCHTQYL